MRKTIFTALLAFTLMSFNTEWTTICTGAQKNGSTVKLLVNSAGVQSIIHYKANGDIVGDVVYPPSPMTTKDFSLYCEQHDYLAGC